MAEHNSLTGASLHEPLGIDTAATSDAGKVVTPDSTTANTGTLRNLVESEINSKTAYVTARFEDITTSGDIYIPMTFAGTVTEIRSAIDGAIGGTDILLSFRISGSIMVPGTMIIAFSGSAAGDVDILSPTSSNVFTAGQYLQVTTNAAGTGAVASVLMFTITRT